jgi:hypothetical protein
MSIKKQSSNIAIALLFALIFVNLTEQKPNQELEELKILCSLKALIDKIQ